jgi:hypothetical protein
MARISSLVRRPKRGPPPGPPDGVDSEPPAGGVTRQVGRSDGVVWSPAATRQEGFDDRRGRGRGSGRAGGVGAIAAGVASRRGSAAGACRAIARRRTGRDAGDASRSALARIEIRLVRNAPPVSTANAAAAACQPPCTIIVAPNASSARAPLTRKVT